MIDIKGIALSSLKTSRRALEGWEIISLRSYWGQHYLHPEGLSYTKVYIHEVKYGLKDNVFVKLGINISLRHQSVKARGVCSIQRFLSHEYNKGIELFLIGEFINAGCGIDAQPIDKDTIEDEEADDDDDYEEEQIEWTSGQDPGSNDDDQVDPPSGLGPSSRGAAIEPTNSLDSQPEPPPQAPTGGSQGNQAIDCEGIQDVVGACHIARQCVHHRTGKQGFGYSSQRQGSLNARIIGNNAQMTKDSFEQRVIVKGSVTYLRSLLDRVLELLCCQNFARRGVVAGSHSDSKGFFTGFTISKAASGKDTKQSFKFKGFVAFVAFGHDTMNDDEEKAHVDEQPPVSIGHRQPSTHGLVNGQVSNEQVMRHTIPMPMSNAGCFGGGSVFQAMIRPSPALHGFVPNNSYGAMQAGSSNPMYGYIGVQPGRDTQSAQAKVSWQVITLPCSQGGVRIIDPSSLAGQLIIRGLLPGVEPWQELLLHKIHARVPRIGGPWSPSTRWIFSEMHRVGLSRRWEDRFALSLLQAWEQLRSGLEQQEPTCHRIGSAIE
ncbi:hypothetical protein L7F22_025892 [Adiantum nelumboides]|nr:hypothetical protein [Adiantum nelumboides]